MTAGSGIERTKLPEVPRRLLGGMYELSSSWLERTFLHCIDTFQQHLFREAEAADNSQAQQRFFDAMRELKAHRAHFWPAFRTQFEQGLVSLPERALGKLPEPTAQRSNQRLSMLDSVEMEETLGLDEIATRGDMRHSQILYLFGMRLGVLAGTPALASEANPFSPSTLCRCLRVAAHTLNLAPAVRLQFYRHMDRLVLGMIDELYQVLNNYLIERNVLPNMSYVAPRKKQLARPAPAVEASQEDSDDEADVDEAADDEGTHPPSPDQHPARDARQEQRSFDDHADAEGVFETLRELLSARRPAQAPVPAEKAYPVKMSDIQAVLGVLQSAPQKPIMVAGKPVRRSVAHLRQDLINHLRPLVPEGKTPTLDAADSDSLELVGLLFDNVLQQTSSSGLTQDFLHRLQAPIARLALTDKEFFSQRSHPARRLMNLIADAGLRWVDDPEADQGLIERMRSMIDQLARDYDGDSTIFEQSASDLEQQLGVLKRKAEVSERRHVDAARGREKLELARDHSQKAIAKCLLGHKPSRLLRTLLEQAWTDVLALTMLRVGEDDPQVEKLLNVARALIAADKGDGSRLPSELRQPIESGLTNVGYHNTDVSAICTRLFEPERAAEDDSIATSTELAVRLKSRARLGQQPQEGAAAGKGKSSEMDPPLTSAERDLVGQLRQMPFGTWFDFKINQQGQTVRRKLSWYSTVTSHCLFVNTRGVKAAEKTLEQLARDIVRGQIAIVEDEGEGLIDRAWNSIMRTLKELGKRVGVEA